MTTYTYEFTAFTEDALLSAGSGNGSNLGNGDSFTMPASADVTFVVTDNDPYLSGDSSNNENANDSSYQTATITIDGQEAGNGGQVYGEQYFWVWGEETGQWYMLIEIEQEGTGDDYFTFYNAYGVPEEGETLTVSCGGNISCWEPHMGCLESPPATVPPVAVLDAITITEGESIGDSDDDAQLNILANDFDTDGTISLTGVNGALPGDVVTVTTEGGVSVDVTVDASGNLFFDTGADFNAMLDGQSDSFELTYTITDNDGNEATSTVTVTIEGESTINAVDDEYTVLETEGAGDVEGNVLDNDTNDFGSVDAVLRVQGQEANVGEWIDLDGGGRVRLMENGELDFDADGDFDYLAEDQVAMQNLTYTIAYMGENTTDEYQCLFFGGHQAGTIIDDQYSSNGVTISGFRSHDAGLENPPNAVMIFDTSNPTGGDLDLSSSTRGNVLIITEDFNSANPDDEANGGTFVFEFDREADVESLIFLDTEEPTPEIRLYDENGNLITSMNGPSTADGEEGIANINVDGVHRMEVEIQGSGAIDNLIYTLKGEEEVVQEDTANVKINIVGLNDLEDGDETATVEEGSGATVLETNALANTVDLDVGSNPQVTPIIATAGSAGGIFSITSDGVVTFDTNEDFTALNEGQTATTSITYTVTDGQGGEVQSTYTVTVNGIDQLPVIEAVNDFIIVGEAETTGDTEDILDSFADTTAESSILANDLIDGASYEGMICEVNGVMGNVGEWIDIAKGRVMIMADGSVDFDAAGEFDALNTGESDFVDVDYTIGAVDSEALDGALNYEFFDATPTGNSIFNIPATGADFTGTASDFDVNALAQSLTGDGDTFAVRYTGFVVVDAAGAYNFEVGGDDGVGIWINGQLVAERDGLHPFETANGDITLSAGVHEIELRYFENTGGQGLDVQISGPDTGGQQASLFDFASSTAPMTAVADEGNVMIRVDGVDDPNQLDDGDEFASVFEDAAPTALTNALVNVIDTDSDPANIKIASLAGALLVAGTATADGANGGSFTFLEDGSVTFSTDGDFDILEPGEMTTTSITYQVEDGDGGLVTSTYTVEVTGVNDAPVAVANSYAINEGEALTGANIITDLDQSSDIGEADSDPNGDALTINSALGNDVNGNMTVNIVSDTFVTVYTDGGVAVEVKLDDAGNLEVSENSEVDAAGDQITLAYTVEDVPANGDAKVSNEAIVTVSIADVPDPAGPEINVVFLLDASNDAISANSSPIAVGDLNNDGKINSNFDLSIDVMLDAIAAISASLGSGNHDVDMGIFSFESQISAVANEFTPAVALQTPTGGEVFNENADFSATIGQVNASLNNATIPFGDNGSDIFDNGAAFMAAAMEAANGFISANDQSGPGGDAINLVYVIGASIGVDQGNDYFGAAGPGMDGNPDGFLSADYLLGLPGDPFGGIGLDSSSDVALTNALLESEDLGLLVDTLYFGSDTVAFNSGLFALENFQPDLVTFEPVLADGTINTDPTTFLNGITTQLDDLLV